VTLSLSQAAPWPDDGRAESSREAALVERARTEVEAFAALYRTHHAAIARYVRRRVGDEHLAADLVAETFLAALESLGRYRERGLPFRAWLYRLASSRIDRWARRRRLVALLPLVEEPAVAEDSADPELTRARRALLALPPRYQTVLSLHYLEGLGVAEIGLTLGCRPGTVKARLARGRARLRFRLRKRNEELER